MMILLMTVMMQVRGGGAEELEPDDEGQLPVRVHQLAADSVLGGGLLVPLLSPPPRPPHHPAHRGKQSVAFLLKGFNLSAEAPLL